MCATAHCTESASADLYFESALQCRTHRRGASGSFSPGLWRPGTRAGLRVPHPPTGPAPSPRWWLGARQTTRMWGPWRSGHPAAHASARSAGADFAGCIGAPGTAMRRECQTNGHTWPTARSFSVPMQTSQRSMRRSRTNCRPPHLRRGRGEPARFPCGEPEGQRSLGSVHTAIR